MENSYSYCQSLLREQNKDAWLAILFAPEKVRKHLYAVYAFSHEIGRIASIVSEPGIGEIRLRWWAEVLRGERDGEATANPVSDALRQSITEMQLPVQTFLNMIEARRFDLYNDPMPALNDLEGYCGEVYSALFQVAILINQSEINGDNSDTSMVCGHAGVAYGIAKLLQALPHHASKGRSYIPRDILEKHGALVEAVAAGVISQPTRNALAEMRQVAQRHLTTVLKLVKNLPPHEKSALVLVSQVRPLLARMNKMDRRCCDPFETEITMPQWRRQWAMWRW